MNDESLLDSPASGGFTPEPSPTETEDVPVETTEPIVIETTEPEETESTEALVLVEEFTPIIAESTSLLANVILCGALMIVGVLVGIRLWR